MMNQITIFLISLLFSILLFSCNNENNANEQAAYLPDSTQLYQYVWDSLDAWVVPPKPKEDTITIVAVGDIMMGTDYPNTRTLPPKDGKTLFADVTTYLEDAAITFGNLEGVIGRGGVAKKCNNPSQCYTFRMPARYTNHLIKAGFDVVSIANNHANDFSTGGRKATAGVLDTSGLYYAGSEEKPYITFEEKGVKYGFLATAPNSGCFSMKKYKKAAEIVAHLDTICDIVIVSFHAGAEGAKHRHTTRKDEVFLGHNRGNIYKFAHGCIDAGADLLLGHGPHVTRAVELYKDRFITYSMGNFCTYDKFSLVGPKGVGPIFSLQLNKKGAFLSGKIIPTKQIGEGIPKYDDKKRALLEVIELTKADFGNTPLLIDENTGIMTRKEQLKP